MSGSAFPTETECGAQARKSSERKDGALSVESEIAVGLMENGCAISCLRDERVRTHGAL